MDVEVKEVKGEFTTRRALVDSGSQGNCIQGEFSEDVLTNHKPKSFPTTMIMADGNQSPAVR
jgi:hypothetical protein